MKKFTFTLLAFLCFTFAKAQEEAAPKATLPDLQLKDLNGNAVNIQDYAKKGKIVIFSFWATWCGPCKKELNNLNDLLDEWKELYDLELVAVCTDNSRNTVKVKPYVDGQGWEFDVIMDPNQDLQRAVNAPNIPFTVLIDQNGNIVYTHLGYVEGDEYELEKKIKLLLNK